jgi:hypothetical protein
MTTSKKVVPLAERTDPFAGMTDEQFAKEIRTLYESWQLVVSEATRRGITIHGVEVRSDGKIIKTTVL